MPAITPSLESLIAHHRRPAVVIGRDYRVLAVNSAYEARYGRPAVGRTHCYTVSHHYDAPCDQRGEACPLAACLETGRRSRVLHVHHGPDGPEHVDVELLPLRDEAGEITGFIELLCPIEEASAQAEGRFIGASPAFTHALALLMRAAPADVPVLLTGESGTGKEHAARFVHVRSDVKDGPFVPVECSGFPETLFESVLFGHERGAFTGATGSAAGLIESALDGTLFLDEIGELPPRLQAKLLRLLESRTWRRVGSTVLRSGRFRLICATNRDLAAMVEAGTFRRDLYHRICVFPVQMPPLRQRQADIPLLAHAFCQTLSGGRKRLSDAALDALTERRFPGNVRELKNVIQRALLLTDGPEVPASAVLGTPSPKLDLVGGTVEPLATIEARYLRWARAIYAGDRRALADALGLSERTLYRKLSRLEQADGLG